MIGLRTLPKRTLVVGGAEELGGAGAAIGRRKGQPGGVLGVIARSAERRRLMRMVSVRVLMAFDRVPGLAGPPHVICAAQHSMMTFFKIDPLWNAPHYLDGCDVYHTG